MDFVHDQLATGKKLRVLTVVDTFSRFSPVVGSAVQLTGAEDVVLTLEQGLAGDRAPERQFGLTRAPSFISRDLDLWAYANKKSRWTSRGRASRRTMRSSRRSMAASGQSV